MKNVLATVKKIAAALLPVLALLKKPGVATAVVGYATPIILGIAGDNFNAAAIVPYVIAVGTVAGGLERVLPGGLLHPNPTPPAPPAK